MARAQVSQSGLPTSHYFLSLSRGDAVRTVMLRPTGLWAIAALAIVLFAWAATATAYLAFHDDLVGILVARQAQVKTAYENRLAEARARFDEVVSQRALDQNSFAAKLRELMSRQAELERRSRIVAALAAESERPGPSPGAPQRSAESAPANDALGAIRALGPPLPAVGETGAARAYAPLPGSGVEPAAKPSER